MRNVWFASKWSDSDILRCSVMHASQIIPQVGETRGNFRRRGLFWKATPFSAMRFVDARTLDNAQRIGDRINEWVAARMQGGRSPDMEITLSLPMVYCRLLASGKWVSCSLPIPRCRHTRSRLGWLLVPSLWAGLELSNTMPAANPDFNLFDVGTLTRIGDVLRACHANIMQPGSHAGLEVRIQDMVSDIDASQHQMLLDMAGKSTAHHDMESLLNVMVFASFLRQSCDISEAMVQAVKSAVPYKNAQEHLLNILTVTKVPSRSTVYRSRFLFVMGFNVYKAHLTDKLLSAGPVVQYYTVDASPQHGIDWVMSGAITLPESELARLFRIRATYVHDCKTFEVRQLAGADD